VIWLHGDHLRADNPALRRYPEAPVVFVFDATFLKEYQFSFQRLFFLYESVLEVFAGRQGACSIRLGQVVEEVRDFATLHKATTIATTRTLGSRFAQYKAELAQDYRVQAFPVPSLVPYEAANVPKRFSAWWREIETEALK
jgi:hypothetical protein